MGEFPAPPVAGLVSGMSEYSTVDYDTVCLFVC